MVTQLWTRIKTCLKYCRNCQKFRQLLPPSVVCSFVVCIASGRDREKSGSSLFTAGGGTEALEGLDISRDGVTDVDGTGLLWEVVKVLAVDCKLLPNGREAFTVSWERCTGDWGILRSPELDGAFGSDSTVAGPKIKTEIVDI